MATKAKKISFDPAHFINRESSWLEFNQRVLEEAQDPSNPLLERVKFFCIVSSNLDEFFEVRVAGIKQQIEGHVLGRTLDGLTASEAYQAIHKRVRKLVADQYTCWNRELRPALAENNFRFLKIRDLDAQDMEWLEKRYHDDVRPVLTPLGIDPAHPFPELLNKSLNIIVQLEKPAGRKTTRHLAIVQVPRILPRLVRLPRKDDSHDYVFQGELVGHFLADIFPGTKILGYWRFRVTRNSELYIGDEDEISNLLKAVEKELHNRRKGAAVRLELEKGCPEEVREVLLGQLNLGEEDLYLINGPVNPTRLMAICEGDHHPELRDQPYVAPIAASLLGKDDLFQTILERDILLHHPYESFESVIEFLQQAAHDPRVLAIKQTLYRTGGDTRIVGALMDAVRNGKQVTAVVELRARFDEANNIEWARRLEEAGVHVVYGLVGYKIHCKISLVVRKDDDGIRRYLHLSTGNYNATTARFYTDIGLFTCHPDFGEDATNLFNLLTGICQFQGTRKFLIAPFDLHTRMVELIRREASNARKGIPARIVARMNSLVDGAIVKELYKASNAGVRIDLLIRGICCLRPGVKGVSENIRVISIVDRYLEHGRIFYFENGSRPRVFVGSADWMPRNFFRRIEAVFPIEDGLIRDRIVHELLAVSFADNVKARHLKSNGSHHRPGRESGERAVRSQNAFMEIALKAQKEAAKPARRKRGKYPRMKLAPGPFGKNKNAG